MATEQSVSPMARHLVTTARKRRCQICPLCLFLLTQRSGPVADRMNEVASGGCVGPVASSDYLCWNIGNNASMCYVAGAFSGLVAQYDFAKDEFVESEMPRLIAAVSKNSKCSPADFVS